MQLRYASIKDQAGALSRGFVAPLVAAFGLKTFIETGTYRGDSLAYMADLFPQLYSIELGQEFYDQAVARFLDQAHVSLLHSDSAQGLKVALKNCGGAPALFWLDAHYSGGDTARSGVNSPIEQELDVILTSGRTNNLILIDDIRYFWKVAPGFLAHDAIAGYPDLNKIVQKLETTAARYKCFVFCDALLAVPRTQLERLIPSDVLQACTQSRLGQISSTSLHAVETTIASAKGDERAALLSIPSYMIDQANYGLGGHYFYWRALLHAPSFAEDLALSDRTGVLPPASRLMPLKKASISSL